MEESAVDISHLMQYVEKYIDAYRNEYTRFVSDPPEGAGYPRINVSPFLGSKDIICYLTENGVAIADFSWEPPRRWEIAGGPAIIVDTETSKTPPEIIEVLKQEGLYGKPIGMYRIVAKKEIPEHIWRGKFPDPTNMMEGKFGETTIWVVQYSIKIEEFVRILTYGAYCNIIDIHLPDAKSDFGAPYIIKDMGFVPADRNHKRFIHYMEIFPHIELAAWDIRSIWLRVKADIRRDFALKIATRNQSGGLIMPGDQNKEIQFQDSLSELQNVIHQFEKLLDEHENDDESVFHDFFRRYPIILDVYGEVVSKPKFKFPEAESPLGKKHIEPDFIVKFDGNQYKLIEIERPSNKLGLNLGILVQTSRKLLSNRRNLSLHFKSYDLIRDRSRG